MSWVEEGLVPNLQGLGVCVLSHFGRVRLFVTLWTIDCQASLSMEFPGKEYWSGLLFPSPGYLPYSGI